MLGYLDANTRAGRSTEVGRGTAKSVLKVRKSWSSTTLQEWFRHETSEYRDDTYKLRKLTPELCMWRKNFEKNIPLFYRSSCWQKSWIFIRDLSEARGRRISLYDCKRWNFATQHEAHGGWAWDSAEITPKVPTEGSKKLLREQHQKSLREQYPNKTQN